MFASKRLSGKVLLVTIIVLSCLFVCTIEQRGGSRSKSSSSSHSSSGSSYRGHRSYHSHSHTTTPRNCTTINGTTTCTYDKSDSQGSWVFFIIILAIFGVIGFFTAKAGKKDAERRQEIIQSQMSSFEARMEEWPSIYPIPTRSAMIDAFMSRSYTMVINVKDQAEKFYCQLKVTDLKRINDTKFEIKMNGSDEVGTSKLEGLMIFKSDGLGIKLSKVYDDRLKAEQTGKYDILFYEGAGNPDRFSGEWAFHGF